jgi:hypothetical protein
MTKSRGGPSVLTGIRRVPFQLPVVARGLEGGCQAFNQYPKYECQHTLHQWREME